MLRKFDLNGLRLCELQGKIFEKSLELDCSTAIFMRRFFNSDYLLRLDKNDSCILDLDYRDAFYYIEKQFGKSNYGKIKESKEALFWLGYLLRYISYTRNVSTSFIIKSFDCKELLSLYYVYHTQDMEWCVRSILEKYNLDERYFDPNYRFKNCLIKYHSNPYTNKCIKKSCN